MFLSCKIIKTVLEHLKVKFENKSNQKLGIGNQKS